MFRHYRFIDYAAQGYVALVAALILLFGRELPYAGPLLCAHVLCFGLVHTLIQWHERNPRSWLLDVLRHFYPIILYTPFYRETSSLNQMILQGYLDGFFGGLDLRLFGCQPSVALMEKAPFLWLSELFYASYFSYYVMIVGVGIALYFSNKKRFFHYVSLVSFSFYVCYLVYIFLPVVGPRLFYAPLDSFSAQRELVASLGATYPIEFPATVQGGLFFRLMDFIYAHVEAHGAAFPSSHMAIALCSLYFSWRYIPRLRPIHTPAVLLLSISTVYCRYHYVVDILGGAATGLALLLLGEWLYAKFSGNAGSAQGLPDRRSRCSSA